MPHRRVYPTLLCFPAPEILVYPREAVVAEKLEAMVVLGDRNSRIKDDFDLDYLAASFAFDRADLAEAVRRARVANTDSPAVALQPRLADFVLPVLTAANSGERRPAVWSPGGPWTERGEDG